MKMCLYSVEDIEKKISLNYLIDYIRSIFNHNNCGHSNIPSLTDIQKYLIKSFLEARLVQSSWSGNEVNLDHLFIGNNLFYEDKKLMTSRYLIFKEKIEGPYFIISEKPIKELSPKWCSTQRNFSHDNLIVELNNAIDIATHILNITMEPLGKKIHKDEDQNHNYHDEDSEYQKIA